MSKPLQGSRPVGALLVELLPDGRLQLTKQGDAKQALSRLLALLSHPSPSTGIEEVKA
ncbi:hypothetical protein PWG14_18525 (plasmid) [Chromobacterium amazonense]|uniref:hypothetical protein n=1 Tax=Chromobacterium amazonense TaxID=1382803 RepID=UPI00237EA774|nr:hypothetical protein [Chromobacterium amazonense]MDE1714503.1 hypothetical protein [Chromobacterium amazonense]